MTGGGRDWLPVGLPAGDDAETMILSGHIGPFSVTDIFQFLSLVNGTGQLVLDTGIERAWVYFYRGQLIYARREGPSERLGERLLRLGIISESQMAGVNLRAGLAPPGKKRIGQILLEAGSLDEETLQRVVRDQIRETVADILAFAGGGFRFFADVLPHEEDILLDVSLDLLLLEGLTRLDEQGRVEEGEPGAQEDV